MDRPILARMRSLVPRLGVTMGLSLAPACKHAGTTDAPDRSIRDWSLAQIEAELRRNGDALSDAGIVVARAEPAPAPDPAPPEVTAPFGPEDRDEEDDSIDAGPIDDGVEQKQELEAATDRVTESESAPEPEMEMEMDAPMVAADSAPVSRRSAGRRQRRLAERRARNREQRAARSSSRCVRICELAESTCDLEVQVCALAERHPDEPRYEQACLNAEMQCDAASAACDRCEG